MAVKPLDEEALFHAARRIDSAEDRSLFLRHACGDDAGLAERVRALLAMHEQDPAEPDEPGQQTCQYEPVPESAGSRVGPYTLREQIGEGGFGLVFVAEQQQPVRRKVALKVIRPGMDTRAVVARFEAERQALALMDHPNIAKVLDAGTTDSGRPYFVMELVKGMPITEYADAHHLTPRDRLGLFVPVCQAVQHAHQKGIIHRDIKPSNVLVTVIDGVAIPKVIDFGVAKAVGQQLTDKTVYTRFAAMIGTPLYMSPEQAELSGVDVDTRADIYALGVLLYELLTGTTPFDRERFQKAAFDEIRRIIKEEEPPRPSTRLTSLGETLTTTAAKCGTEPGKLAGVIRGELDWIVMRCLEKDRARRYETATGLAKDVQRHLTGDAVEACPPTLGYRLRKVFRRNRGAILTATTFAAVLLVATGVSLAFGIAATQAERRAVQQEEAAQENARQAAKNAADALGAANEREMAIGHLSRVLAKFNPYRYPNGTPPVPDILAEACRTLDKRSAPTIDTDKLPPIVRAKVRGVFGRMYVDIHKYEDGQRQLLRSYEELKDLKGADALDTLNALEAYANALVEGRTSKRDLKLAEEKLTEVHDIRVRVQGAGHPDTLRTLSKSLRWSLFYQMDFIGIRDNQRRAVAAALANPDLGEDHEITAEMRLGLANMLTRSADKRDLDEARDLCQSAIRTLTRLHGPNHPVTLTAKIAFLFSPDEATDFADRVRQMGEAARLIEQANPTDQNELLIAAYDNFALSCLLVGKPELAGEATEKLLRLGTLAYGKGHPYVRRYHGLRGWYLAQVGQFSEAEKEANITLHSPDFTPLDQLAGSWDEFPRAVGHAVLAKCILRKPKPELTEDDFKRAEQHLRDAKGPEETTPKRLGPPNRMEKLLLAHGVQVWIELYEKRGMPDQVELLRKQREQLLK